MEPREASSTSMARSTASDSLGESNPVASQSLFQSAANIHIYGGNFTAASSASARFLHENQGGNVQNNFTEDAPGPSNDTRHNSTASLQTRPDFNRTNYNIYYEHIAVRRRGSPLWIPEPNKRLHKSYRRNGMSIGDVGIITDTGIFDFLFNICLPYNDPINPPQLPENFAPFSIEPSDILESSEFLNESYLSSASVRRSSHIGDLSGMIFEISASEGAVLTMPVGLNSEDLANKRLLRKYAAMNAEHWYRYIIGVRGREIRNGDVRLVVGYDKTAGWGMATFSNLTAQGFQLKFRPVEHSNIGKIYEWEYSGKAETRAGPHARDVETLRQDDPEQRTEFQNQCLFVRTLNITLQDSVWKKLESELDAKLDLTDAPGYTTYSDSPRTGQRSANTSSSAFSTHPSPTNDIDSQSFHLSTLSTTLTGHPSAHINEMLLKRHPHVRMAVTEDHDWISVIKEDDFSLPPGDEIYKRIMESSTVGVEKDNVFLEKKDTSPTSRESIIQATNEMLEVLQLGKQDIPETPPSILEHLTELQEESSTPIPMTDVEWGKITRKASVKDDDDKEDVVRQPETVNGTGSASSSSDNTKAKEMWVRERETIGGGGSTQFNDYLQSQGLLSSVNWEEFSSGPQHAKEWKCVCKMNGQTLGVGISPQKRLAKRKAADVAFATLTDLSI